MKGLLEKKNRNSLTTKREFIADVETLFAELKNSYGGYECFGEARFETARVNLITQIEEQYTFEAAIEVLRKELASFIFDGHFSVDGVNLRNSGKKPDKSYDYAVKQYVTDGVAVFDIKRFYYENEEERQQLETFAKSGELYRDYPYLIFDLRYNNGGSDTYLWEFLKGLTGEEPDVPLDFVQKNSDIFLELLKSEYGIGDVQPGIEAETSEGKIIRTKKKIYVLINQFVCSSGESAIAYLKTLSGTTVVGENSGGCYFSGNCMSIYLPNSGIEVYYGTGRVLYNGKNIDELGGFTPDIYGDYEVEDVIRIYVEGGAE